MGGVMGWGCNQASGLGRAWRLDWVSLCPLGSGMVPVFCVLLTAPDSVLCAVPGGVEQSR